jgi:large subunit ribosomal protein L23
MGILDRLSKKTTATEPSTDAKKKAPAKRAAKKVDAPTEVKNDVQTAKAVPAHLLSLLARPRVSEKAARLGALNTYVFEVPVEAEKIAIKRAVEATYGVKVAAVRTIRGLGKPVRRGRRPSARQDWKKALVTLVSGQKLDLYAGV